MDELVPGAALGELAQGHHDLAPGHLRQVRLKGLRSGSSSPGRGHLDERTCYLLLSLFVLLVLWEAATAINVF